MNIPECPPSYLPQLLRVCCLIYPLLSLCNGLSGSALVVVTSGRPSLDQNFSSYLGSPFIAYTYLKVPSVCPLLTLILASLTHTHTPGLTTQPTSFIPTATSHLFLHLARVPADIRPPLFSSPAASSHQPSTASASKPSIHPSITPTACWDPKHCLAQDPPTTAPWLPSIVSYACHLNLHYRIHPLPSVMPKRSLVLLCLILTSPPACFRPRLLSLNLHPTSTPG